MRPMRSTPARGSSTGMGLIPQYPTDTAAGHAVIGKCGRGWPLPDSNEGRSGINPASVSGILQSWTDRTGTPKRKWPKEVLLGEHTSLGPKSYCPDYRNLPV